MPSAKNIWILAEQGQGQLEDITLELVSGGRQLADKLGEEVYVVVIGSNTRELVAPLASYGADKVYFLDSPLEYSAESYVEALAKLFEEENPAIVLCGTTLIGRDLAPRLAARLKTGLVSECIGLALNEEGVLLQTKLTYGGKIASTIICPASRPQMATVKPGVIEKKEVTTTREPEVKLISLQLSQREPRCSVKGFVKATPETIGLDEADVIVSGGRGVGSAESFQLLSELAKSLGGVVAGSLVASDEGWVPRNRLVGQTGMTVIPRLYVACGISGSIYHIMGMKDSKFIVAINKDRNAPIFKCADMGIIGDVVEVVPAITNQLRELSQSATRHNSEASDVREV